MCHLLERQNPVIAERPQPQDHCRPGGIQIREFGSCKIPEVGKQGRQAARIVCSVLEGNNIF